MQHCQMCQELRAQHPGGVILGQQAQGLGEHGGKKTDHEDRKKSQEPSRYEGNEGLPGLEKECPDHEAAEDDEDIDRSCAVSEGDHDLRESVPPAGEPECMEDEHPKSQHAAQPV